MSKSYVIPLILLSISILFSTNATRTAAHSMAPINENSFRNWKKYRDRCDSNGFDPFKASDKK